MRWLWALVVLAGCRFGGSGEAPIPAEAYDPCDFGAECPSEANLCREILIGAGTTLFTGAVCTVECSSSSECPDDGACAAVNNSDEASTTCQRPCEADLDCPENYNCVPRDSVDLGAVRLCMPTCRHPDNDYGSSAGC